MEEILQFISANWPYILIGLFVLFLIIGLLIANFSYDSYMHSLHKMHQIRTSFSGNAVEFANILSSNFFMGIICTKVVSEDEMNSNGSYTPSETMVTITEEIAYENSIASLGIVAHELGHAMQHKDNPKIMIENFKLLKTVKFLGALNFILIALSVYFFATANLILGIVFLCTLFLNFLVALGLKLSTLHLEKDASEKAINILRTSNIFSKKEINLFKKFLNSAKKTYTGDFFRALLAWTGLTRRTKLF